MPVHRGSPVAAGCSRHAAAAPAAPRPLCRALGQVFAGSLLTLLLPGHVAHANPQGHTVVHGQASVHNAGNLTRVTNSAGAILHWQTFSIGKGERTEFWQPNAGSMVLNRVVTANPSQLFGTLWSNGKVVLVNPAGIAVGQGALVDTAGFTASTLAISNADWIAGRLRFVNEGSAGAVQVDGSIRAQGGDIVLLAPKVDIGTQALVQAKDGSVVVAAGQKAEITGRGLEGIVLEVRSGATATNLGKLEGDAVGIFAGTLKHSGVITARTAQSVGGRVVLLGDEVKLTEGSRIDASGKSQGGVVQIGGEQGGAPAVAGHANARNVHLERGAVVRADAEDQGNGGRVIVWADDTAVMAGSISARGGPNGGNGGFVETSGKKLLVMTGDVSTAAPKGKGGTWLLDPEDVDIEDRDENIEDDDNEGRRRKHPRDSGSSKINADSLVAALNAGGEVIVDTTGGSSGNGDIRVNKALAKTSDAESILVLNAHRNIVINEAITSGHVDGILNLVLNADSNGDGIGSTFINNTIRTQGGQISLERPGGLIVVGNQAAAQSLGLAVSPAPPPPSSPTPSPPQMPLFRTVTIQNVEIRGRLAAEQINLPLGLTNPDLTILRGLANWTAGTVISNARLVVGPDALLRLAGIGTSSISGSFFNNSGVVDVPDGTLTIGVGGTDAGRYTIGDGATVNFAGGTRSLVAPPPSVTAPAFSGDGALQLSSGTLSIDAAKTIATSAFRITGGTIGGAGELTTTGSTTIDLATPGSSLVVSGKTWVNNGTLTITGDDALFLSAASLRNNGTLVLGSTHATPLSGSSATVTNAGTLDKTAGGARTISGVTFDNSGTVNVDAGTLVIQASGTDSGVYAIDPETTLEFASGTREIDTGAGGVSFTGTGNLLISGGTVNINNALAIAQPRVTLAGGTLGGGGNLTIASAFDVTHSSTITGTGLLTTSGPTTIDLASTTGQLFLTGGKDWVNSGTLTIAGDDALALFGSGSNRATLTNTSSGVIHLDSTNATPITGSAADLNNDGTLHQRSEGVRSIGSGVTFNTGSTGRVNVNAGTLRLQGSGTDLGDYVIAAGKTLDFAGGTRTLDDGVSFTGAGTLQVSGGDVDVEVGGAGLTISEPTLNLSGGTLGGGGNLTLTGTVNITGSSTITGSGLLTTSGTTSIDLAGTSPSSVFVTGGKDWTNSGTLTIGGDDAIFLGGSGSNAASLTNTASGTLLLASTNDTPINGSNAVVTNLGTLRLTQAGTHGIASGITFHNQDTGAVHVDEGTLVISGGGTDTGDYLVAAGKTLNFAGGTRTLDDGVSFTGAGTLQVSGGDVHVEVGAAGLTISEPTLNLSGGTLAGGGNLTLSGTVNITGSSTIAGAGLLATSGTTTIDLAGASPASLFVTGGKDWTNSGTLTIGGDDAIFLGGSGTNAATLTNTSTGTILLASTNDAPLNGSNAVVTNLGTLRLTRAGTHGIASGITFHNQDTGAVHVDDGSLVIGGGGLDTGDYAIAAGTTLAFAGGTRTLDDGVSFTGAGTLQISGGDVNVEVGGVGLTISEPTLNLSGGTLAGGGDLTLSGTFNVTGGTTLAGAGLLTTSGSTTVSMPSVTGGTLFLSGGKDWTNSGTLTIAGNDAVFLSGSGANRAVLTNTSTGRIALASSNAFALNGSVATIENQGRLDHQVASHTIGSGVIFHNTGTVNVDAATLSIDGGGSDTGLYAVDAGATLDFGGGTRDLNENSNVTGAGAFRVSGGTVNVNHLLGISTTGSGITISGGTLNANTALSVNALTMSGSGTLGGNGDVTVTGPFDVTGNATLAGSGAFTTEGDSTVSIAGFSGSLFVGDGKDWTNKGTLTIADNDSVFLSGSGTNRSLLTNASTGRIALTSSNAFALNGSVATIENQGTLDQQAASHTIGSGVAFHNSGTVNVDAATLAIDGGGTDTGLYAVDAGATLQFGGGTRDLNANSNVTGAGAFRVSGGTVNVNHLLGISSTGSGVTIGGGTLNANTALSINSLDMSGSGTLGGSGAVTVSGPFTVSGNANLAGSGLFTTQAASTIAIAGFSGSLFVGEGKDWVNNGTLTIGGDDALFLSGSGANRATLTNSAGASLVLASTNANALNGSVATIENRGTLDQQAADHTIGSGVIFHNTGTVNVDAATLAIDGGGVDTGRYAVDAGATLEFGGGTRDLNANSNVTGAGAFRVSGGTVNVNNLLDISTTGSGVTISGGTLNANTALTINTLGMSGSGTLGGSGAVTVSGPFTVSGNANLSGSGLLTTSGNSSIAIAGFSGSLFVGDGKDWVNRGTLTIAGDDALFLSGSGANRSTLTNSAGARIVLASTNANALNGSVATFDNQGTLDQGTASHTLGSGIVFNNTGTVNVDAATLSIDGGGSDTGQYAVDTGTTLDFRGGTRELMASSNITGEGKLRVSGGTLNVNHLLDIGATGSSVEIVHGTLNANSGIRIAKLDMTGSGTLGGTGAVTVTGPFTVTQTSTLTGTGQLTTEGSTSIDIPGSGGFLFLTGGKTWVNKGSLTLDDDDQLFLGFASAHTTLRNEGTLDLRSSVATALSGSNATLTNAGTLNQAATDHSITSGLLFNNAGTVNVDAGTLTLSVGGSDTGLYALDAGTTLALTGFGLRTLGEGTTFTGAGTLRIDGGSYDVAGGVTMATSAIRLAGGAFDVSGRLTVDGPLDIGSSVVFDGSGVLNTKGATSIDIAGASVGTVTVKGMQWINEGTLTLGGNDAIVLGGALTPTTLTNKGTVNLETSHAVPISGLDGTFVNAGTLNKSHASAQTLASGPFHNRGTVNVDAGSLTIADGGTDTGLYAVDAGTSLVFSAGTRTLEAAANVTGAGALAITGGTVTVDGALGIATTGTGVSVREAAFNANSALSFARLDLDDATLGGTGAVTVTAGGTLGSTGTSSTGSTLALHNAGTVHVDSGTLSLNGGGTDTGTYDVDTGATLVFGGGTRNLDGTSNVTGGGTLTVSGSILNVNNALEIANTGAALNISSATLNANTALTVHALNMASGALGGSGSVTLAGSLNSTGSSTIAAAFQNTGTASVNGGSLTISSGGSDTGSYDVDFGATLRFAGGTRNLAGGSNVTGAGTLAVSGGTLNVNGGLDIGTSGTGVTVDGATLNANTALAFNALTLANGTLGGTGAVTLVGEVAGETSIVGVLESTGSSTIASAAFHNRGAVHVQGGTLRVTSGGTDTGAYGIDAGSTLAFAGTRNVEDGAGFFGSGTLRIAGGTLNVNAPLTITEPRVQLAGGTLGGPGALTLAGPFDITGTSILAGTGLLTTSGTTAIDIAGTGGTLSLAGGKGWLNTGTVMLNGDDALMLGGSTSAATLTNNGTMVLASSHATPVGGSNAVFSNAGTLRQAATGTHAIASGIRFDNSGTVNVEAGTLAFAPGGTQSGTLQVAAGATLAVSGGFTSSGTISGNGSVDVGAGHALVNEGTIAPGASAGTLSIVGDLDTRNGTLAFELASPTVHDRLHVSGTVMLGAGTVVRQTDLPGASYVTGDAFDVILADTITGPTPTVSRFTVSTPPAPSSVFLRLVAQSPAPGVPPPPPPAPTPTPSPSPSPSPAPGPAPAPAPAPTPAPTPAPAPAAEVERVQTEVVAGMEQANSLVEPETDDGKILADKKQEKQSSSGAEQCVP